MEKARNLLAALAEPFRCGKAFDVRLMLVFGVINGLALVNATLHDPNMGYDSYAHLNYIQALSKLQLVTPEESYEFFSPPLPYALPALFMAVTGVETFVAARLAQYLNVFLSIGLTFYLVKTCHLMNSRSSLKLGALIFLGILPVYYKTFAFVRGEPYVAFFAAVILYYTMKILVREQFTVSNAAILGTALGLCALSRQWGFFLLPPVISVSALQWFRLPRSRGAITRTICLCLALVIVTSGWFYLSLRERYGSSIVFNRPPAARFAFANQPPEFYCGLGLRDLFARPVRPHFPNQLIPTFYSEVWGDYWCYFAIYGRDIRTSEYINGYSLSQILSQGSPPFWLETNYEAAGAYLGRVNLVSTFPSLVAMVSLVAAALAVLAKNHHDSPGGHRREINAFLLLAILFTFAGYFWFLIMYPNPGKGDTIKATYALQAFPFAAILVGLLIDRVERKSHLVYQLTVGGLGLTFVHNLFAMLTHYPL